MKKIFRSIVVYILTAEAAWLLKRHKPMVIAVAGSVGKTSTKDAVFAAIKNFVYTRKSEKSFNSELGIPLTVLGLRNAWSNPLLWLRNIIDGFFTALFTRTYPEVLVLEVGVDAPGDMKKVAKWLAVDILVMTRLPNVPVHVENFGTVEAVIAEKMEILQALKPDGVFVYNRDDTKIQEYLGEVRQKTVGYSRYLDSDFKAGRDKIFYQDDTPAGIKFTIKHLDNTYEINIKDTIGLHFVYAGAAAMAAADELSVPPDVAAKGISTLSAPAGRMRIIKGIKGSSLIDDTYNSSPVAVEQALQVLSEIKYTKRKIAVLGDMLELGKYSSAEHKRIGKLVPKATDILITVGIRARSFAEGALAAGMSEENIFQYDKTDRAGRELQNMLHAGDVVLVKASQGIRAERIVEEVMLEPEKASELLVRQSKEWSKIK